MKIECPKCKKQVELSDDANGVIVCPYCLNIILNEAKKPSPQSITNSALFNVKADENEIINDGAQGAHPTPPPYNSKISSSNSTTLIRCSECGYEIPHKASFCPYCGCPVEYALMNDKVLSICSECGADIPSNVAECPNCGCPVEDTETYQEEWNVAEEPKSGKKWAVIITGLIVGLIVGVAYSVFSKKDKKEGSSLEGTVAVQEEEEDPNKTIVELTPEFINAIDRYDQLGMFSEGLAAVSKNGKWGYINTKGEEVIPLNEVDCAGRFSEGLAFVLDYSNFYVIDITGRKVFSGKPSFDSMHYDSEDMPYFIDGKLFVPICESEYKYAIYNRSGQRIGTKSYEEGSRFYRNNSLKNGNYYTLFSKINNGYDDDGTGKYKTYGLKDSSGRVILPAEYNKINGVIGDGTRINASNGVVLVVLSKPSISNDSSSGNEIGWEDMIYCYGYADLNGNDTFSDQRKQGYMYARKQKLIESKIVGSTYSGAGNGGGLGISMLIHFYDNNMCEVTSDFHHAYITAIRVDGTYKIVGNRVKVHVHLDFRDYDFNFKIENDGKALHHDESEKGQGSAGNDYLYLELLYPNY